MAGGEVGPGLAAGLEQGQGAAGEGGALRRVVVADGARQLLEVYGSLSPLMFTIVKWCLSRARIAVAIAWSRKT